MMTLVEFFSRYKESRDIKLFLEIKDTFNRGKYIVDKIEEMLREYSWWKKRTMIISFDDELIDYISCKYPSQYIGALGDKVVNEIVWNRLGLDIFYKPNFHSIQIPMNEKVKKSKIQLATKGMINKFKERNQLVVYWGVNNQDDMKKLINVKAHVITSDRPDILAKLLNRI